MITKNSQTQQRTVEIVGAAEPSTDEKAACIIVGVDGSDSSLDGLRYAIRLASALKIKVKAITAWYYPVTFGDFGYIDPEWSPETDAKRIIESAVNYTFWRKIPEWFSYETIEGNPSKVLIQESENAEMLIIGGRGIGGFSGLLLGSVSYACSAHSKCPILIMHNKE